MHGKTLEELLPEELKAGLTSAETIILQEAPRGDYADFTVGKEELDDLDNATNWKEDRIVRASFLYWLCTNHEAINIVHAKGVQILGAKVSGGLDFRSATIPHPLSLTYCSVFETISFADARTRSLRFTGSHTGNIYMDSLVAQGDVFLDNTRVKGEVRLLRAMIFGGLTCVGTHLDNPEDDSMNADSLSVKGDMFLRNAQVKGEVRLLGATIGGDLDCIGARFDNPEGKALSVDNLSTKGSFILRSAQVKGELHLLGANIGKDLDCTGALLEDFDGYALSADGLSTQGSVNLCNAQVKGEVRLLGATIGGDLDCTAARFENISGYALNADRFSVEGAVFLRETQVKGEVRLPSATIGGSLSCINAQFENPEGNALNANRFSADGAVFLRNIRVKGEIQMHSARIGGLLDCRGAQLENPMGYALIADGLSTQGSVDLCNAQLKGEVRLLGATIGGDLNFSGAQFEKPQGFTLNAENIVIGKTLFLRHMKERPIGGFNFLNAKTSRLIDDESGWPQKPNLHINGFLYESLGGVLPPTAGERLKWLVRQPDEPFLPQPYEQMAKVFKQTGQEEEARKVLIAKQDARLKHGELSVLSRWWLGFLGITIRYGYEPWRVISFMVAMICVGWAVFKFANLTGAMIDTRSAISNPFNAFVYSLEVFIPIVDLHQESYWLPDGNTRYGSLLRFYFWIHIALGWISTTLLVSALTGLIKKE